MSQVLCEVLLLMTLDLAFTLKPAGNYHCSLIDELIEVGGCQTACPRLQHGEMYVVYECGSFFGHPIR